MNRGGGELQPDSPLKDIERDQLGYDNFSAELADILTSRVPADGYTIGIYGEWGSGKSTILNFTETLLNSDEESESPIIVRFNPWWFSGKADLTEKFFAQLGAEIGDESAFPEARANLAKLSSTLSHVPFQSVTGLPVGQAFAAANSVLQQEEDSVSELKDEISEILEGSDKKIVVIVDDLDRLAPEEIAQMLQVIKSVGDFPNVSYVLAFDPNIVSPGIERVQDIKDGREYLRKIINLPLPIPMQKQNSLYQLFRGRLSDIPGDFIFDTDRGRELLGKGIIPILDTPRDVIRLGNTIDVMYTALGNEVNFVDLIGIETLRVFHDDIYKEVRSSPGRFTGQRIPIGRNNEPESYSDLFKNIDDQSRQNAVEVILKILFPKVRSNMTDSFSSYGNWDNKKVERRICHSDRFPVYFRLDIPGEAIPVTEINSTISLIDRPDEFITAIEDMLEENNEQYGTKASAFMHDLSNRVDQIDSSNAGHVVQALFKIGDDVIKKSNTSRAFYPQEAHNLVRMIKKLLQKQEGEDSIDWLEDSISQGRSPYLSYRVVRELLSEHDEYENDTSTVQAPLFELEQLEKLKPIIVEEIANAAENGELLEMESIMEPLSWWSEWTDHTKAKDWVEQLTSDDDGLLVFIDAMSKTTILGGDNPALYLDPRWIDEYLDRDNVRQRLNSMNKDNLRESGVEIIERFYEGEEILDDDLDASSVEIWFMAMRS